MRAIVISQEKLRAILQETRDATELSAFRERVSDPEAKQAIGEMHRKFNYHLCRMVEKIESEY